MIISRSSIGLISITAVCRQMNLSTRFHVIVGGPWFPADGITKSVACFQDGITKSVACFQDGITKSMACFQDGITKSMACFHAGWFMVCLT